jgi:hypothetical protein
MPFSVKDSSGADIGNVYVLATRVWNKGTDSILGSDMSKQHPLIISIERSTRVLGKPIVRKPNPMMVFKVDEAAPNKFKCTFDCLNPGEWVTVNFFTTGEPRPAILASGRVHGQNAQFDVKTDDTKASWSERVASLILVLVVVFSPVALLVALFWAHQSYTLAALFTEHTKLPTLLTALFSWGVVIPMFYLSYFGLNWFERRRNPKGYPIRADLPGDNTPLRVFLLTAIKGVRYRYSRSLHNFGELVPSETNRADQEIVPGSVGTSLQSPNSDGQTDIN